VNAKEGQTSKNSRRCRGDNSSLDPTKIARIFPFKPVLHLTPATTTFPIFNKVSG
jgi:hypothetical protein